MQRKDLKQPQKHNLLLNILIVLLVAGLCLLQIVLANQLSTDGARLAEIERKIRVLERENLKLKKEIAEKSSLKAIVARAKALGFVQHPATFNLAEPVSVALKP